MQQATDFADESRALETLIAPLSDAALLTETLFKRWTISDIIGHLHMWNWAADLSLSSREDFMQFSKAIAQHHKEGGTLNSFERGWLGDLKGRARVDAWAEYYPQMAARFAEADPSARVAWAGPDMSVRSSITARLMETWAHAQAIYDALGTTRVNTDRIRNIVVLGINTYGWTFKNRGLAVPDPMPHVVLTAPSGALWEYGTPGAGGRIEGPAEAFCQVVTQTRNVADVALTVSGDIATQWMEMAQCFAGAPETPPAPGVRRRTAQLSS